MRKYTPFMASLVALVIIPPPPPQRRTIAVVDDTSFIDPMKPNPREPDLERILAAEAKRERKRLAKEKQRETSRPCRLT